MRKIYTDLFIRKIQIISRDIILFIFLIMIPVRPVLAGDIGHYVSGSWGGRDLLPAPQGSIFIAPYAAFYHADEARDGSGHVIDGSDGVKVTCDSWMTQIVIGYTPKIKVLGADWGIMAIPAFGAAGAAAKLTDGYGGQTLFDDKGTGLADWYIMPANLSWQINPYITLSAQYGFWAPVGKYSADSTDNVGLGYWSNDFRGTFTYYPMGNPGILIFASVVEEINGKKQGYDLTPAPHTSGELGFSMALSEKFMFGLLASGIWETGSPKGSDANEDGRDRMFNAGAEASYYFIPAKLGATLRILKEFEVLDRFEGATLIAGLNFLF